jgi:hypothetical protein
LRGAFGYTVEFYKAKLRELGGKPPVLHYPKPTAGAVLSAAVLRYVSSVTLLLDRDENATHR